MTEGFHIPVMVTEVLEQLAPAPGGRYLDGTVGGGGHAEAVLQACSPDGALVAADRDPEALDRSRQRLARYGERVTLLRTRFDDLPEWWEDAGRPPFDGILLDLGVSSHQLDEAGRGFSFSRPGPLDMRMGDTGPTAAEQLAALDLEGLTRVLRAGEVPMARKLAAAILAALQREELATTADLAAVVEAAVGGGKRRQPGGAGRRKGRSHHPATLVFQALRMEVNEEMQALRRFLDWMPDPLAPGGRLVILSYHSLEDRQVKRRLQELSRGCICPPRLPVCACGREPLGRLLVRRAQVASPAEVEANPRARSAKLRVWQRSPA